MTKAASCILLIAASICIQSISGATLPEVEDIEGTSSSKKGFTYLGAVPGKKTSSRGISTQAVSSYYFLSQNSAGFSTADSDCKAYLGEEATLLCIETQEELGNVTRFLQSSDDTGSTYWVGGKYSPDKAKFIWNSGAEIGPWAPWDQGHPNTQVPVTRVSAFTAAHSFKLRTEFQTVSNRYICELKSGLVEEEATPCYTDNDLVIVVDSSGSIGQSNYMIALEFTTRLAIAWADNPQNRLSVIIFASTSQAVFNLGQKLTVSEIRDLVYSIDYLNGGTQSHLGLNMALDQFKTYNGTVPKNMVFLTDGASADPAATAASARNVNAAGVKSFSVGIGSSLNMGELLIIAGNEQEHVFDTTGFDNLLKLLQPVSESVCEDSKK